MKIKLGELAALSTGYYTKPAQPEEVVYVQGRDLVQSVVLKDDLSPSVPMDDRLTKHLLKSGDVLISSKGSSFPCAVWRGTVKAVASTQFLVIDLNTQNLIPEFLVWYLNTDELQLYLQRNARGSSMLSLNKSVLEELEIPIPTIQIQESIVNYYMLSMKENELQQKLAALKQNFTEKQLLNLVDNHE